VGLQRVWIRTLTDGLLRADQVVGVSCHRTPAITGKPARWLLTVSVPVPAGSGNLDGWDVADLHRTLAQTSREVAAAPGVLVRLLSELSESGAAGIITPVPHGPDDVRFEFAPFDRSSAPPAAPELVHAADVG